MCVCVLQLDLLLRLHLLLVSSNWNQIVSLEETAAKLDNPVMPLALELNQQNIPFAKEKKLDVFYDGLRLNNAYVAPFICYNKILLEVRSLEELQADQRRQSINTLKATNLPLCLLINFGGQSLTWQRLIHSVGV